MDEGGEGGGGLKRSGSFEICAPRYQRVQRTVTGLQSQLGCQLYFTEIVGVQKVHAPAALDKLGARQPWLNVKGGVGEASSTPSWENHFATGFIASSCHACGIECGQVTFSRGICCIYDPRESKRCDK